MRKGQRGLVKRTSKRPPTTDGSARARRDGRRRPLRQHGVGVQEQERIAPRHPRARVHLARPPARARDEADGREAPHHLAGRVRAAAVDDDDFLLGTAGDEVGQEPLEIRRLVERGHDDAQHPTSAQRVQASQSAKSRFTRGRAWASELCVNGDERPVVGIPWLDGGGIAHVRGTRSARARRARRVTNTVTAIVATRPTA